MWPFIQFWFFFLLKIIASWFKCLKSLTSVRKKKCLRKKKTFNLSLTDLNLKQLVNKWWLKVILELLSKIMRWIALSLRKKGSLMLRGLMIGWHVCSLFKWCNSYWCKQSKRCFEVFVCSAHAEVCPSERTSGLYSALHHSISHTLTGRGLLNWVSYVLRCSVCYSSGKLT